MAPAFIPVCPQPLQGPLHLKLHILCSEGVPCHREVAHGFRPHLHNHMVTGWEEVAQVVGKAANPGRIASLHSDQTHCMKTNSGYTALHTHTHTYMNIVSHEL